MQLSAMRDEARKIFNETDASNSHISETELNAWANECYRFILTRLGAIPIKERDYTSPSSGSTFALNANTLTIDEAYIKAQPENKFVKLEVIDQRVLNSIDPEWPSADTDIPHYLMKADGNNARLYPPPNAANQGQTIRTYGLEFPSDMSADTDTPTMPLNMHDLFPHYMAHKAFAKLANAPRSTDELIFVNSQLKAMQSITTGFSKGRRRWLWAD